MELITSDTIGVSEWTNVCYYGLFQYCDKQELEDNPRVIIWLGVSQRVGISLCHCILTSKGKVISSTTAHNFTKDESATDYFQRSIRHYHKCLD